MLPSVFAALALNASAELRLRRLLNDPQKAVEAAREVVLHYGLLCYPFVRTFWEVTIALPLWQTWFVAVMDSFREALEGYHGDLKRFVTLRIQQNRTLLLQDLRRLHMLHNLMVFLKSLPRFWDRHDLFPYLVDGALSIPPIVEAAMAKPWEQKISTILKSFHIYAQRMIAHRYRKYFSLDYEGMRALATAWPGVFEMKFLHSDEHFPPSFLRVGIEKVQ